jgi:hypothetical protein
MPESYEAESSVWIYVLNAQEVFSEDTEDIKTSLAI